MREGEGELCDLQVHFPFPRFDHRLQLPARRRTEQLAELLEPQTRGIPLTLFPQGLVPRAYRHQHTPGAGGMGTQGGPRSSSPPSVCPRW